MSLIRSAVVLGMLVPSLLLGQGRPVSDSTTHRPRPFSYFARSLLIPGWGQASLNRKVTGGIFVAFEGIALGMMLKAGSELHYLQATNSDLVPAKKAERQDWLVLMVFNHLFSGLEAYVSAHLFEFPADLGLRTLPNGRTGFGLTVPVGH